MNMSTNINLKYARSGTALLLIAGLLSASIVTSKPATAADGPAATPSADTATSSGSTAEAPAAPSDAAKPALTPSESCSAAYERTQTEKLAGHYVAASAAALECSQLQCNAAIVQECVRFYSALEAETPTLVFSAHKAEGGDLVDVRVEMDGKVVAESITGRPFATDPGPHEFVFIHKQRGRLKLSETARVGDKARAIDMTFPDPNAKSGTGPHGKPGVPVLTYVLGGVGVVALGAFAYLHFSGVSDYNNYNNTCSPGCNPDDVDSVKKKFTMSYVALGVGGAAIAGAAVVYLTRPKGDQGVTVQASVSPRPDGGMAGLKATF